MFLDDIPVGMTVQTPPTRIEKDKMLAFSKEYDPFPIHIDEEYAKSSRFGRLIAPGVMSFMAVWRHIADSSLIGDELVAGLSTKITWTKPVFADDVLTWRGTVTAVTRRNPYNGIMELTLEAYNQNGEHVLTGVIESVMKYRT